MAWLLSTGHLDRDVDRVFVGPAAERRYGAKHFLELLSVFTSNPQFLVLNGRTEVGAVDPMVLTRKVDGPRVLALGGRSWLVTHVDWRRRRVHVEPSELRGAARWSGASQPLSYALTDAMRRVLLDGDCGTAHLTARAVAGLALVRQAHGRHVSSETNVITRDAAEGPRLWTWAGARANTLLTQALQDCSSVAVPRSRLDNRFVALSDSAGPDEVKQALSAISALDVLAETVPSVDDEALRQLKFTELLPTAQARQCLATRHGDLTGAVVALERRAVLHKT